MTAIIIVIAILILFLVTWIIYQRRSLEKFRANIKQGDHINLRVKTQFINVLVIRPAVKETLLIKQFGRGYTTGKVMYCSLSNCYPL